MRVCSLKKDTRPAKRHPLCLTEYDMNIDALILMGLHLYYVVRGLLYGWLWYKARTVKRAPPTRGAGTNRSYSVICCLYKEANILEDLVRRLRNLQYPAGRLDDLLWCSRKTTRNRSPLPERPALARKLQAARRSCPNWTSVIQRRSSRAASTTPCSTLLQQRFSGRL